MQFSLTDATNFLQRTPVVLRNMLHDLPDHWVRANYGPQTFSPFDVVGHLIHGEKTDWIPRMNLILEHGETRPFEPFDRYAMYETSKGKSMRHLLDEFESLRASSLRSLQSANLDSAKLQLRGTHPVFGSVTLEQLLATWVAHDLNHIAQICKGLAHQHRDAVGPWREYLSILK